MPTKIKHTARYETPDHKPLVNGTDLAQFLSDLPDGVVLSPITWDVGSQRDPNHVMVGLVASWETRI